MNSENGARRLGSSLRGNAPDEPVAPKSAAQVIRRDGFRKDIQGLRAVAVVSVLCFHLRPWVLPGGFIGVDVFFVISGYLITDLLLREFEATGTVSIAGFYARRLKRPVPIATVVLLTVAVCVGVLPVSRWRDVAAEMNASALYYQNWHLADRRIGYFAPTGNLAPLQHYWSLSVEEQYCILLRVLLVAGKLLSPFWRAGSGTRGPSASSSASIPTSSWSRRAGATAFLDRGASRRT